MGQGKREDSEEQGPDSGILATRKVDEGIEIIAAVDYDEALVREAARHGASPAEPPALPVHAAIPPPPHETRVETPAPANRPTPVQARAEASVPPAADVRRSARPVV